MVKNIIFAAGVLSLVGLLYFFSTEVVVPIPSNDSHIGLKEESSCFECHGDGKEYARKKDHPPKDRCFKCHDYSVDHTKAQE
jgi:hypothetical protein